MAWWRRSRSQESTRDELDRLDRFIEMTTDEYMEHVWRKLEKEDLLHKDREDTLGQLRVVLGAHAGAAVIAQILNGDIE